MTTPAESADAHEAVRAAQIDALFRAGPLAVSSAAAASVALFAVLLHLGYADATIGSAWSAFVVICALAHILLGRAYARAQDAE